MRLGPPPARPITPADIEAIMNQPARVQALSRAIGSIGDGLNPVVDVCKPYLDGLEQLPRDGRFLLVGNHTQFGIETLLVPYCVRRELGRRVRPLADRAFGQLRGPAGDLLAACGAVVGHPDTARELMRHDETVLVFPGGGREIPKFKGEEYQLRWAGRSGFARMAIEHSYSIVPVGLVGGDDVYRSLTERDSVWGRLSQSFGARFGGRNDMAMPLLRGIGPTLVPRPQRMYVRFGSPISTAEPAGTGTQSWEAQVKSATQEALERILADLQHVRAQDPFRGLNPLAWRAAVQPANR